MNQAADSKASQQDLDETDIATVNAFYRREIGFLQSNNFEGWLDILDPDIHYQVFTCVTTKPGDSPGSMPGEAYYYDDNLASLTLRTKKLRSSMAWTESPATTRRYFLQTLDYGIEGDEISVCSNLLVLTSRGDQQENQFCGERNDRFSRHADGLKLLRRNVQLDKVIVVDRFLNTFF